MKEQYGKGAIDCCSCNSRNYEARIITRDQKLQGGEKRISKMIISIDLRLFVLPLIHVRKQICHAINN